MRDAHAFAPYLWILTTLLVLRVVGQLIVVLRAPSWLPPMDRWQSGLVPYWFLLSSQCVVVWLMVSISIDFTRGRGYWLAPAAWIPVTAFYWSFFYAGAMAVRVIAGVKRYPIPIVFHTVVALFQWMFGFACYVQRP